ncbi:TPA: restriction endonuclease subunit S [Escherichia coli]|uniref:restriction endonuclease subunit S n=1 Tax=Escherichia coli TaxID=562 RepID=UPI000BE8AAF5|nr:restriction endonuclease subunit S [Escherichia coli]HDX9293133.1 restriction endonuclease subunit S [Escherichia coli]
MSAGKLPEGWVNTTIENISVKCSQRVPAENEEFIYVDIGSINRELKFIETPQYLSGKNAPSRARKVIKAGDVIVSLTRPNLNAVALVDEKYDDQIASTGFEVIHPVQVESKYIFGLVRSRHFIDSISGLVQGALYPAAKSSDVQSYEFPLPPLAEQKIIAEKLDTLLAQVDSTKARLEQIPQILKRFRQAVLGTAVSGKLISNLNITKTQRNLIKFEDVLKDKKQLSYGVLKPGDYEENGVPMIRVMDIGNWGELNKTDIFKISQKLSIEFKRTIVEEGDIILSIMATIGRAAIVPDYLIGANVNRALAVIKLSDKVLPKYVLLQLLSPQFQATFVTKQMGSAQKRINLADLRQFDIWVPHIEYQSEIVRRVEQLFAYADTIEKQVNNALARVNNLTQSILAKAFRGELTAQWRAENPELISGENSAAALLEKIKAERAASGGKKASRKKS